jgi:hypothetical protein
VTGRRKPCQRMTAADVMAKLAEDEDYQRKMAAAEAERKARVEELRRAERPVVAELRSAGVDVASVWDLVNTSSPYPGALPILLDHLQRGGYPDRVMESISRALAVEPAAFAWETFRSLYLSARGRGEMEGLAVALAASATPDHLEDLISLLSAEERGDTRVHLLRAILRVGGHRGRELVATLQSDPTFGSEARAILTK